MIKGEIEEIEKAEKLGGNLEYTEFDFQVIIPKFYSIEKFSGEIEIEIIEEGKEKEIKCEENKYGVYNLLLESEVYFNNDED